MIRRPPRSTLDRSSAASDVYKRQDTELTTEDLKFLSEEFKKKVKSVLGSEFPDDAKACLLYTSPSPRDRTRSRMPSSA